MASYKIEVIKLLMKNNKMAEYGTIHDAEDFNSPEELLKEGYISKASKSDIDAFNKEKSSDKSEADKLKQAELEAEKIKQSEADKLKQAAK